MPLALVSTLESIDTDRVSAGPVSVDPLADLAREAVRDRRALGQLLLRLGPSVLRVARGVLGASHADLDDAVQESLVEIANSIASFRGECTVAHFACRIAARRCVRWRRRAGLRSERERRVIELEPEPALAHAAPERRRAALRALLDSVPEEQAEALVLRFVAGLSLAEVAEASGAPLNTVRSRLRLAKENLQKRIADDPRLAELLEVGT